MEGRFHLPQNTGLLANVWPLKILVYPICTGTSGIESAITISRAPVNFRNSFYVADFIISADKYYRSVAEVGAGP